MKGTDIFSIKGIVDKMPLKKGESSASAYNNIYYLFKGAKTGVNEDKISKMIKIIQEESELLISELNDLKIASRKPRTTKKQKALIQEIHASLKIQ